MELFNHLYIVLFGSSSAVVQTGLAFAAICAAIAFLSSLLFKRDEF